MVGPPMDKADVWARLAECDIGRGEAAERLAQTALLVAGQGRAPLAVSIKVEAGAARNRAEDLRHQLLDAATILFAIEQAVGGFGRAARGDQRAALADELRDLLE